MRVLYAMFLARLPSPATNISLVVLRLHKCLTLDLLLELYPSLAKFDEGES